eukprot:5496118-Amphidinium_carterae.1
MVCVDYCYLDADAAESACDPLGPILVTRDRGTSMLCADVVPRKGPAVYSVQQLTAHITQLRYARLCIRHDGENPMKALVSELAVELKRRGLDVSTDPTPSGKSNAAGVIESCVGLVKEQVRTIWAQAAEEQGVPLSGSHTLLPWAVRYAAQ